MNDKERGINSAVLGDKCYCHWCKAEIEELPDTNLIILCRGGYYNFCCGSCREKYHKYAIEQPEYKMERTCKYCGTEFYSVDKAICCEKEHEEDIKKTIYIKKATIEIVSPFELKENDQVLYNGQRYDIVGHETHHGYLRIRYYHDKKSNERSITDEPIIRIIDFEEIEDKNDGMIDENIFAE